MYKLLRIVIAVIIVSVPISVFADDGDLSVGDVDLSGLGWGDQTISIEVENKTDYLKYIISNTNLTFEGVYANPEFRVKTVYILEPYQKINISPEFFIPGNYGTVTINLTMYDVIDTLDELMPWSKFYEQPFIIKFHPSDEILPYLQEKTTFPPRVDVHPYFNNEFVRLLFTLLSEGKSVEEIASMNKCDVAFVQDRIDMYVKNGYLKADNKTYKTTFPFITRKEAEGGKKIADSISDKLAALINKNFDSYFTVIDELVTAKIIPRDSNDFISGASLLYKPTPVISTFVLWFELGKNFITRSAPLVIYDGTDICDARNLQYMYMVDGGPYFNGSHFFGLFYGTDNYSILFSADPLRVICKENFQSYAVKKTGVWNYDRKFLPEFFIVDSADVRPLITALTVGSKDILKEAYNELKKNSLENGHEKVAIGQRYWMWNLIATLTLDKLYANGTLQKRGDSYFRYDKVKEF